MQRVGYYFEIEYFWLGTFFITDDEWYDYLILDRRQSPLNVGYRVRVKFSSCFSNQIYLYILTWCEHNRRIDLVDHSPSCISPSVSVQVENYPLILTPEKSERNARSCQSSTHASSQFPNANGLDSCPVMVSFRLLPFHRGLVSWQFSLFRQRRREAPWKKSTKLDSTNSW